MARKIVIVGGVAGGATCAARLRRLSEEDEIVVLERGEYISFANCGLPYYVGDVIKEKDKLLVITAEHFRERFNVDVRTFNEAVKIDRDKKRVVVKDLKGNKEYSESYDVLILSPGAQPVRPPLPGIDDDRVFTLRTVPDAARIRSFVEETKAARAVVVGGGFIGLEMAENFRERGVNVTVVEMLPQVMPNLDPEIANLITQHMKLKNVGFVLGSGIKGFKRDKGKLVAEIQNGTEFACDLAVLAIGVRPDTRFIAEAGVDVEKNGAIKVDAKMRTNDPAIFALGDAVIVDNPIVDAKWGVALAWPANRQARVVADVINGIDESYPGTIGTSVVKIFDLTVASTGCSEKYLQRSGIAYQRSYTHSPHHVGYYPGAVPITIKLTFDPKTGKIFGVQAVGTSGVDKRVDVIAAAIRCGARVSDLKNLECAYAPPYGAAKDPVNVAGMAAENIISGKVDVVHWDEVERLQKEGAFFLDVRTKDEYDLGTIAAATNIPVDEMRPRLDELPKDKPIVVFCQVGLRGYIAARMLSQRGFKVSNLSGGYKTYTHGTDTVSAHFVHEADEIGSDEMIVSRASHCEDGAVELDACGLLCPGPIRKTYEKMETLKAGEVLRVHASDPGFASDIQAWCTTTGNDLLAIDSEDGAYIACIRKSGAKPAERGTARGEEKTIVVFSGEFDRVMAAFIIATGAASMGKKVNMFFTFWGLNALRKHKGPTPKKDALAAMFARMMPRGVERLKISKLNMGGIGTSLMKRIMKKKNVDSLPELLAQAQKMGVKLIACQMTMDVMGLSKEELIDDIEFGGVAHFLADTDRSDATMFI